MRTCLICDNHDAHHRYACPQCIAGVRRRLRELLDYEDILAASVAPAPAEPGRVAPGYKSQPPINVDVVVMLDHRSKVIVLGPDDDDEPPWSIRGQLRHLAAWLRAEFDEAAPRNRYASTDWAYIFTTLDRCASDEWIANLASIIGDLWHQARARAHDQPPPQVGVCCTPGCGGWVYRATLRSKTGETLSGVRCGSCRRTYTGLDLVTLRVEQEAS